MNRREIIKTMAASAALVAVPAGVAAGEDGTLKPVTIDPKRWAMPGGFRCSCTQRDICEPCTISMMTLGR